APQCLPLPGRMATAQRPIRQSKSVSAAHPPRHRPPGRSADDRSPGPSGTRHLPVYEQQEKRAQNGQHKASEIKAVDATESEQRSKEAAKQRPGDAEQDRDDDAARVVTRHDEFRDDAGNESENDPSQNSH